MRARACTVTMHTPFLSINIGLEEKHAVSGVHFLNGSAWIAPKGMRGNVWCKGACRHAHQQPGGTEHALPLIARLMSSRQLGIPRQSCRLLQQPGMLHSFGSVCSTDSGRKRAVAAHACIDTQLVHCSICTLHASTRICWAWCIAGLLERSSSF